MIQLGEQYYATFSLNSVYDEIRLIKMCLNEACNKVPCR
jgi:hypothetical protein